MLSLGTMATPFPVEKDQAKQEARAVQWSQNELPSETEWWEKRWDCLLPIYGHGSPSFNV